MQSGTNMANGPRKSEVVEDSSSNWQEFANLVQFLEGAIVEHKLAGSERFIFTDNIKAEAAFWKGNSSSRLLFDLILRLQKLEMDCNMIIHVVHVAGKRMIDQGTDGLSRADHTTGAITGRDIRHWVPLNLGAFQRSPDLSVWLDNSFEGLGFSTLTPEGWYTTGHEFGNHIWAPPPSACEVVVKQLGQARIKRPESAHLIIVPRLMTGRWRQHLGRGSDGYFKIQDSPDIWDLLAQFEPLLIFVCLNLCHLGPPWNAGRSCWTNFRGLCQERTCRRYLHGSEGIFCANYWDQRGKFAPCQGAWCPQCLKGRGNIDFPVAVQLDDEQGEVITSDQEEKWFREAHGGDHLITPFQCETCHFQCETCHFRNMYSRDP
jgi:hypothetical protein